MLDFEVQRCTRHCAETGRDLLPGEPFYSVLKFDGREVQRYDYCQDAWQGPPDEVIGWWRSRMPDRNKNKARLAPSEVMLELLRELEGQQDQADTRLVLSLLLLRRRILRLKETLHDEQGHEHFVLFSPRDDETIHVAAVMPVPQRVAEIEQYLGQLLFSFEE